MLSTYSSHDFPLTELFQLAVRRADDVGELKFAGEPSPFQALGGFGAQGCKTGECELTPLLAPQGGSYPLSKAGVKLFCLKGDEYIKDHGGISNEATWWALMQQVKAN